MKAKVQISVLFPACGAELHPGFSRAVPFGKDFKISHPLNIPGFSDSEKVQREWAEFKIKHLLSWGAEGVIVWEEVK